MCARWAQRATWLLADKLLMCCRLLYPGNYSSLQDTTSVSPAHPTDAAASDREHEAVHQQGRLASHLAGSDSPDPWITSCGMLSRRKSTTDRESLSQPRSCAKPSRRRGGSGTGAHPHQYWTVEVAFVGEAPGWRWSDRSSVEIKKSKMRFLKGFRWCLIKLTIQIRLTRNLFCSTQNLLLYKYPQYQLPNYYHCKLVGLKTRRVFWATRYLPLTFNIFKKTEW